MKKEEVGIIYKLSSGNLNIYTIVNFELNTYEVCDFNKTKADDEFIREAASFAKAELSNYQKKKK